MKKKDLARLVITWLLGYVLFDAMLPISNWLIRFWITGGIVTAILILAVYYRFYQKKLERKRKLVDWTNSDRFWMVKWDQETNILSLLMLETANHQRNWRLQEEVVQIDTFLDLKKSNLYITMEGIEIALDGKTILEEESDGLLLKQENVWLKIPDCDVVRKFFASAN